MVGVTMEWSKRPCPKCWGRMEMRSLNNYYETHEYKCEDCGHTYHVDGLDIQKHEKDGDIT